MIFIIIAIVFYAAARNQLQRAGMGANERGLEICSNNDLPVTEDTKTVSPDPVANGIRLSSRLLVK